MPYPFVYPLLYPLWGYGYVIAEGVRTSYALLTPKGYARGKQRGKEGRRLGRERSPPTEVNEGVKGNLSFAVR